MKKHTIAVLFGGCSSEYSVSLHSAQSVLEHLDPDRWQVIPIGITRAGDWFHYTGPYAAVGQDTWTRDPVCLTPVVISQNRGTHGLLAFTTAGVTVTRLDCALPVLHGKNGEDGSVQGLFQLAGIPVAGCGLLASALAMDKDRAHKLAALAGIKVPRSLALEPETDLEIAQAFSREIGYPLFVKPVKAGSSHGITKVSQKDQLEEAIALAFRHDDRVLLEEAIQGFEVGCALLGSQTLTVGELDEIELSQGFFDYYEKYNLDTSSIHVPARLSPDLTAQVKTAAQRVYHALDCAGFARVDLFVTPAGEILFNEVNTIPGFTQHSRFPAMMEAAGLPFPALLDRILKEAMDL